MQHKIATLEHALSNVTAPSKTACGIWTKLRKLKKRRGGAAQFFY